MARDVAKAEAPVATENVEAVVEAVKAKAAVDRQQSTCLETSGMHSVQRSNRL